MSDFPHVPVGISERAGGASPLRDRRGTYYRRTREFGFGKCRADLFWRTHVVRQFDSRSTMTAKSSPESKYHWTRLKETHLTVRLSSFLPANRFVKGPSNFEIVDSECYQTDALLHSDSMALVIEAVLAKANNYVCARPVTQHPHMDRRVLWTNALETNELLSIGDNRGRRAYAPVLYQRTGGHLIETST